MSIPEKYRTRDITVWIDGDRLAVQAPTWATNPSAAPEQYDVQFDDDPITVLADYVSDPRAGANNALTDPDMLDRQANHNRQHPFDPVTGVFLD